MANCKIAVFENPETGVEIRETEIPVLKKGEILVKNQYTTLCRSDILTYTGKRIEKTPTILGHEITGYISAFGPDTETIDARGNILALGDSITWAIYASDPASYFSQMGIPQKAAGLFKYGHEQITPESTLHGGLGEYTILRRYTPVIRISDSFPKPIAALINCSVATVAGAIRLARDLKGKNVLISGTGMLGVIACAMAKVAGASTIFAVDINPERLEIACRFGANQAMTCEQGFSDFGEKFIEKTKSKIPIQVMIDFSGSPETMEATLEYLQTGGTAVWIGATYPQRSVPVNAEKMVRRVWTIKGLHNYNGEDFLKAVEFMEQNYLNFPFDSLIYDGFSLDRSNDAFQYAIAHNPFRVGIMIP